MPFHLSSALRSLASTSLFKLLSRFFYPELLMAGIYLLIWIDPYILGRKGFEGLSLALWLEFVLAHAGTGLGIVGVIFPNKGLARRFALSISTLFYFLFVGGICWVTGNIVGASAFLILGFKRIMGSHSDSVGQEIFYSFIKAMVLILAGGFGYVMGSIFPAAIENLGEEKGAEMVPAWGVIYFTSLHFLELRKAAMLRNKMEKAKQ